MNAIAPKSPLVFEEYFDLGQEETASPFLTPSSRKWSVSLTLKAAILATFLLLFSFLLQFHPEGVPLSHTLLTFVYFLVGIPALIESLEDLTNGDVNIDILMTLAAFSSILIGSSMEGALLLVLFALSGAMEDAVTAKAKGAISHLKKIAPTRAHVINEEGSIRERSIQDIATGTLILIRSGEIVPLDGIVVEGTSSLNLSHLTGEQIPVVKTIGDLVPAGARNLEGSLTLKVLRTSQDSTLMRIIQLVTEAEEAKPRLQRTFDRLSRGYAIAIMTLAALFACSFPFFLDIPFLGEDGSLYRALAFLIAASPCALIIAIPIAYLSATSAAARNGILIKGGIVLDAIATCKTCAFDKTGTLTTGNLEPVSIEGNGDKIKALSIAAALEKRAIHPIAEAICRAAVQAKAPNLETQKFEAIAGKGVKGEVAGIKAKIGHVNFIEKEVPYNPQPGELIAVLEMNDSLFLFRFRDCPRKDIQQTITTLQDKRGLKVVMLTGDHEENAKRLSNELGIRHYFADLKPEDKLQHVAHLSKEEGLVMIGDGINDAPALARATVGICMGKVGETAAMEASDVVLLHDNIEKLDWLLQKAKKTTVVVRQNLALASFAILIATVPALAGLIPLWLAVVLHEGGTVLVGLNGLRLLK